MDHRALRDHCKVPTGLVLYRGAGRGLNGYSSRKAKVASDLA
jgi:hypothetical protein